MNLEEIEADEFASRFLNTEDLLFPYNYCSPNFSAPACKVSKTALWKRPNNLNILSLLNSKYIKIHKKSRNTILLYLLSTMKFALFLSQMDLVG